MNKHRRLRGGLALALTLSLADQVPASDIGPQNTRRFQNLQTFKREVIAGRGVVASNEALASAAGQQILMKGGNAVDAMIGTFFALSVVVPWSMSPFGSGFITARPRAATKGLGRLTAALGGRRESERE